MNSSTILVRCCVDYLGREPNETTTHIFHGKNMNNTYTVYCPSVLFQINYWLFKPNTLLLMIVNKNENKFIHIGSR